MILYYAGLRPIDVKAAGGRFPANVLLSFNDISTPEGWKIQAKLFRRIVRGRGKAGRTSP